LKPCTLHAVRGSRAEPGRRERPLVPRTDAWKKSLS
jgi:hypothetical protein